MLRQWRLPSHPAMSKKLAAMAVVVADEVMAVAAVAAVTEARAAMNSVPKAMAAQVAAVVSVANAPSAQPSVNALSLGPQHRSKLTYQFKLKIQA